MPLLEVATAGFLWFAGAATVPLEPDVPLPLVMLFLMFELLLLTAVVLPVTVLPAVMPLLVLLAEVVPDETAAVVLPVVLLTLEPPLSEVLLENTLSDPV